MIREITGRHVLIAFLAAFGVIIAVNLTLAFKAVSTFPGLEVRNTYVASQTFEAERAGQDALNWDVSARVENGILRLSIEKDGTPVRPEITSAIFGRATHTRNDQTPDFTFDGAAFTAPVEVGPGNWNLRLNATSADGTHFQRRLAIVVGE